MQKMKSVFVATVVVASFVALGFHFTYFDPRYVVEEKGQTLKEFVQLDKIQNGDIIFQNSLDPRHFAFNQMTGSPYTHCGIIYQSGLDYYVFEVTDRVTLTPLAEFVARGKDEMFAIKRLKTALQVVGTSREAKMVELGSSWMERKHDDYLEWSDDQFYSAELVWKLYQQGAGIHLGEVKTLKDFDIRKEYMQRKLRSRYYDDIPLDEPVISPACIFEAPSLYEVKNTFKIKL
jgi:hypothetical protein